MREDLLLEHEPLCVRMGPPKIRMPSEGNDIMYFKNVEKQLRLPFIVYGDFETILVPQDEENNDRSASSTEKTHEHQASGFSYILVSEVEDYNTPPVVYRGENAIDKFLECLLEEEKRIKTILKHVVPMQLSELEEVNFQNATHCHICEWELDNLRVRDHCHLTGRFRGAAHSDCSLNYKFPIPLAFHNLKNFDGHLLVRALGKNQRQTHQCHTP